MASKFTRSESSWLRSVDHIQLGPLWLHFVSGIIDRSMSVMHVLYTFPCNVPHTV